MRLTRLLTALFLAVVCGRARAEDPADLVSNIADVAAARKLAKLGKEAVPALLSGLATSEHKDVILNILGHAAEPSSLPAILEYTTSPIIGYRMAACYALRNFSAPQAVPAAAKLLGDPSARVRIAALHTLLARRASAETQAISKLLTNPEWPVRKEAARVLGELKSRDAVANLIKRLSLELVEKEPTESELKSDEPELVPKYEEPVPAVRMECIRALGEIAVPEAVEGFVPLFAHGTRAEQQAAVDAVEKIGNGCADVLHGRIQYSLKFLGRDSPETTRNVYLAVALARLDDERATGPAIDLLPLADTFAQIELIRFLGERKSAEAAPPLAKMLKSSQVKQVHEALAKSLKRIGKPASDALLELLPDRSVCVEVMTLLEAPELRAPKAAPQFLKHLEDEDYDIRLAAVGALVAHKTEEAVPALKSALVLDPDERVREAAADALKAITGKDYRK